MHGKVWVLDTETKGTGAQMVPLESVLKKPEAPKERLVVARRRAPRPPAEPDPRPARRFRVVDVVSRELLADDADLRATLELLGTIRSSVDVNVSVWEPDGERWRLLTLGEQRLLWERRTPSRERAVERPPEIT